MLVELQSEGKPNDMLGLSQHRQARHVVFGPRAHGLLHPTAATDSSAESQRPNGSENEGRNWAKASEPPAWRIGTSWAALVT